MTNDLTTLDHLKGWLGLTGLAIAAVTQANPAVVTLQTRPQTPLLSGLDYAIAGATGMPSINGTFTITVIDPLNFSIPVDTTASPTYTGGAYVGLTDPLLSRLITACSAYVQNALNRSIRAQSYTETRNGQSMRVMLPQNYPIQSITSLSIDGQPIPLRPTLAPSITVPQFGGYVFDSIRVMLDGYLFTRGFQNVTLTYIAGFGVFGEAQTVPAVAPYTLSPLSWSVGDVGVTYANGTALVAVASNPVQGQYSVSGQTYTFAAADAAQGVLLSYGVVPTDIEQLTLDLIGDWFKYRDRIGNTSLNIDGQSTSFVNVAIPARAMGIFNQYKRVAPTTP